MRTAHDCTELSAADLDTVNGGVSPLVISFDPDQPGCGSTGGGLPSFPGHAPSFPEEPTCGGPFGPRFPGGPSPIVR